MCSEIVEITLVFERTLMSAEENDINTSAQMSQVSHDFVWHSSCARLGIDSIFFLNVKSHLGYFYCSTFHTHENLLDIFKE